MLEKAVGDHRHQRVAMEPSPFAAFEVVRTEFLLELLMSLLADPARLDRRGERPEVGVGRRVDQIVFLFTGSAPLANESDLFARHMLYAFVADPLPRPVCDAHSDGSEAGLQRPLAPTERAPLRFGQHVLSTDQEDIGHMPITMAAARGDGEDESDITRVNLLMARNADLGACLRNRGLAGAFRANRIVLGHEQALSPLEDR